MLELARLFANFLVIVRPAEVLLGRQLLFSKIGTNLGTYLGTSQGLTLIGSHLELVKI
jgi:hypothetical protein